MVSAVIALVPYVVNRLVPRMAMIARMCQSHFGGRRISTVVSASRTALRLVGSVMLEELGH